MATNIFFSIELVLEGLEHVFVVDRTGVVLEADLLTIRAAKILIPKLSH
jgi:hypothetical protein